MVFLLGVCAVLMNVNQVTEDSLSGHSGWFAFAHWLASCESDLAFVVEFFANFLLA